MKHDGHLEWLQILKVVCPDIYIYMYSCSSKVQRIFEQVAHGEYLCWYNVKHIWGAQPPKCRDIINKHQHNMVTIDFADMDWL